MKNTISRSELRIQSAKKNILEKFSQETQQSIDQVLEKYRADTDFQTIIDLAVQASISDHRERIIATWNLRKRKNEAIEKAKIHSLTDPLTGIGNRRYFDQEIAKRVQEVNSGDSYLMSIDFDNFKRINDIFGHGAGDFVLERTTESIKRRIRSTDVFARVGGDEFCIILDHISSQERADQMAEEIVGIVFQQDIIYEGKKIPTKISIGVQKIDNSDIAEVKRQADKNMYSKKKDAANDNSQDIIIKEECNN